MRKPPEHFARSLGAIDRTLRAEWTPVFVRRNGRLFTDHYCWRIVRYASSEKKFHISWVTSDGRATGIPLDLDDRTLLMLRFGNIENWHKGPTGFNDWLDEQNDRIQDNIEKTSRRELTAVGKTVWNDLAYARVSMATPDIMKQESTVLD